MDIVKFSQFLLENKSSSYQTIPEGQNIESLSGSVKFGIDPTSNRMHLGHLIPLRIVKQLREKGCTIKIILGTFTAQMGDPSGRDSMRPVLSSSETDANANALLDIVYRVVGKDVEVYKNGDWFNKWTLPKMMNLLSKFSVNNLTSRDAFKKRMESGGSLGMHELIVPILQGIDSVEINADIEVGGSDQLFNFHITREVQEAMGQKPETCVMAPIINGLDGRKMSKSYGNCIFLDDSTKDVFGKAMSISDNVMKEWYPIFFSTWNDKDHPMKLKKDLAEKITDEIWGEGSGKIERDAFEKVFQDKKLPQDIKDVKLMPIIDMIASVRNSSRGDARKLIIAGGVYRSDDSGNLEKITVDSTINVGDILKIGKRDWVKVV